VEVSWDEEEQAAFAEGIRVFRKNFAEVARQYLPSKTVKDVIAYYYRYANWLPHSDPGILCGRLTPSYRASAGGGSDRRTTVRGRKISSLTGGSRR
jgi:hypothetical protein